MNRGTPTAIILGMEHFVAKKLAEELVKKDILVVGEGEEDLEIDEASYVFDFLGDGSLWPKIKNPDVKVSVICVNRDDVAEVGKRIERFEGNWRLVIASGVYGAGMEERGFLSLALKQAVMNKNLVLPSTNLVFRLLAVDDLVEVILRASFLSGTEKDVFLAVGNEINSEEVARVLIEEAKMTRNKVIQSEIVIEKFNKEEVEATRKRLRWEPKIEFKKGIKETLQYFFSKIDEESRNNKKNIPETSSWKPEVKKEKMVYEVMVEEPAYAEVTASEEEEVKIEEREQDPVSLKKADKAGEEVEETDEVVETDDETEIEKTSIESVDLSPLPPRQEYSYPEVEPVEVKKVEVERIENNEVNKKIQKSNFGMKWMGIVMIILTVLTLAVPLNWVRVGAVAVSQLKNAEKLVKNKQYKEADLEIEKAKNGLVGINENIDSLGLNKISWFRNLQELVRAGEEVSVLAEKLTGLASNSEQLYGAMFQETKINWDQEMNTVKSTLVDVESEIGILQARLKGNWNWLPGRFKTEMQSGSKQLDDARKTIELTNRSWEVLPELIGLDGKRREYLVLFQNENELRPNGGFIGSYGILTFSGGRLENLEIKDVYEADGQLKGHVEPPPEIKNILGEANFYMRDANWSASFPDSVIDLEWFLEKETGKKVDGVIGIDLAVAKDMIGVVGEVYVPDFKEKINKDNLYEKAEYYAETKFFPGSKQKAGFLGSLGKQLFEEFKSLNPDKRLKLYETMMDLLERNEVQVVLNKPEAAKILANMGWDGAIYQGKCSQSPTDKGSRCMADYLYLVEANLGVNKANYFVYRNIEEMVDIQKTTVNRKVKIVYENTAKSNNWPAGDYKNYLRIYLPSDVVVGEVSVTDEANSKKVYSGDELKINNVYGKKEVGFLVTVPFSKKRTVEVTYASYVDLSKVNQFSYLNYIQRQPGSGDTGMVVLINMPTGWQASQVQPAASLVGGKLLFNTRLDKDLKMGVEMGK